MNITDQEYNDLLDKVKLLAKENLELKEVHQKNFCSQKYYDFIINSNFLGMVVAEGIPPKIIFANSSIAEILEYSIDEFLNLNLSEMYDLIFEEDRELFFESYRNRLLGLNAIFSYEFRAVSKSGKIKWFKILSHLIEDDGNDKVQAIFFDITQQKVYERNLELSREMFRKVFESSPNLIFVTTFDGASFKDANDRALEFLGFSKNLIKGENIFKFLRWKDKSYKRDVIRGFATEGFIRDKRVSLKGKDGKYHDMLVSGEIVEIDGEKHIISQFYDLTNLTEANEKIANLGKALNKTEKLFSLSFEEAGVAMFLAKEENGLLIDCNHQAEILLKTTKDKIVGKNQSDLHPVDKVDLYKEKFLEHLQGKNSEGFEGEVIASDNSIVPVLIIGRPFSGEDNDKLILGVFVDLSDRKKIEEAFLKVSKMESISVLAGGIAHDFNNLLTAIFGNLSLIKNKITSDNPIYEFVKNAENASLKAKGIAQQLLTFSKGGEPIKKVVNLVKILQDIIHFVVTGSDYLCKLESTEEKFDIEIDVDQISQVFHNLLLNAIYVSSKNDEILINIKKFVNNGEIIELDKGDYVLVSVSDNGDGIDEAVLDKIFDPFFTTKDEGNGLGLAISYSIVKKHLGHIGIETGKDGTTFKIYLPFQRVDALPISKKMEEELFTGKKILLMDDQEIVANVAKEMFGIFGVDVVLAKNGKDAVEIYKRYLDNNDKFDFVILDLTIPGGIGGKECYDMLRDIDSDVVAVFSSGYSNDPHMSNYREYGIKDILVKPYKMDDLQKLLHNVFN